MPRWESWPIITESVVIDKVCKHLQACGCIIVSSCKPTQRGDDIVAKRGSQELRIEAKGEGSEKSASKRHGLPFTKNQVRSHVAAAFYRAAKMRTNKVRAGMAFPDNGDHRDKVADIASAIRDLGIVVFWVKADGSVRERH